MAHPSSFFGPRVDAYRASASHADADELARMLALVGDVRGARALDVATGGAHTARALAQAGAHVVVCDATRGMLEGLPWPGVVADAQALPLRAARFDVVACRIAAHHFPDLRAFAREAARVLRPGGRLYVFDLATPDGDAEAARAIDAIERLRDPTHAHSWSAGEWRDALEAAGLRATHLQATSSTLALGPWIARARMPPAREAELRARLGARPALHGYGLVDEARVRVLRVELVAMRPSR